MSIPRLPRLDRKNGPLQIVHDFEFVALNLGDGYTELRDMNSDGKYEYMCTRVKKLADRGYGGIVLNTDHLHYLECDDDVNLCLRIAKYAKSLGLYVWIYDEQYYPAGAAGGLALRDCPEIEALGLCERVKREVTDARTPIRLASPYGHSEMKYALAIPVTDGECDFDGVRNISDSRDLSGGVCCYLPAGEWEIHAYFYRAIYECSQYCRGGRASRRYVNVFDRRALDRFYDVTFTNGYGKHLDSPLGEVVDAVFTDEPNAAHFVDYTGFPPVKTRMPSHSVYDEPDPEVKYYPYVAWAEDLPTLYFEKYGEELIPLLPHLFAQTPQTREVRCKFYSLTSDMMRDGFVSSYRERLAREGVALGGHYLWEESLESHPKKYGDIIDHLGEMTIPGCDNLKSAPEALRYCMACKLASSAAHLTGKRRVMIEASNMTDANQDITLTGMKGAVNIMLAHGVNLITSYYGEDILPPKDMAEYAGYVANMTSLFAYGKYRVDTLLYYPYEQFCARTSPCGPSDGLTFGDSLGVTECAKSLMKSQIPFDIINRRHLLNSRIAADGLVLENGEVIKRIVLPSVGWVDGEVSDLLTRAKNGGVDVVSFDGMEIEGLGFKPNILDPVSIKCTEFGIENPDPSIAIMQKDMGEYDLFLVVNTSECEATNTLRIRDGGNSYATVDATDYTTEKATTRIDGDDAKFDVTLPPLGALIIMRY